MQDPFKPTTSSAEMASGYMPTPDQPARADSVPAGAAPAPDSGYKPLPFGGLQAMEDDDEEFQKTLGELTTGRVADVADLETAFEGIYGGDPVGLESFDLGFFKDGTPAIVLNGAPVPIEQSMWMALLNKRQQSRQEMDARMRFEVQKRKATDFVSKTVRAIPNLPPALAQTLVEYTQLDPEGGIQNAMNLLPSMSADGGRSQTRDLQSKMHQNRVGSIFNGLTKSRGKTMVQRPSTDPLLIMEAQKSKRPVPLVDAEIDIPSPIQQRLGALMGATDPRSSVLRHAYQNIDSVIASPNMVDVFGEPIGIATMAMLPSQFGGDNGSTHPLARMQLVMDMANDSMFWGQGGSVQKMEPPPVDETTAASDPKFREFVSYLKQVDMWASSTLGYGMSDEQTIVALALHLCKTKKMNTESAAGTPAIPSAPASQQAPQAQPVGDLTSDLMKAAGLGI